MPLVSGGLNCNPMNQGQTYHASNRFGVVAQAATSSLLAGSSSVSDPLHETKYFEEANAARAKARAIALSSQVAARSNFKN